MSGTPHRKLKVFIIGSGAIGTYVGGRLALAGHHAVFLERPHRVSRFKEKGITIDIGEQTFSGSPARVVGTLEEGLHSGPYDVGIFALKAYHTQDMAEQLGQAKDPIPPLVCLQNGIGNEDILAQQLNQEAVIPGTITTSVSKPATGHVVVRKKRGLGIGVETPLSARVAAALKTAGIHAVTYDDSRSMKWTKLITNLMANASCAILDMPPGDIYADRDLYRLEINQLREALAVMKAQGLAPVSLPGIPTKLLAWIIQSWPPALSQTLLSRVIQGGRGGKMPSFHVDLHTGKGQSEVDFLNGAVARAGTQHGVDTPVNDLLNRTLLALVEGRMPLDSYAHQPRKLLDELP